MQTANQSQRPRRLQTEHRVAPANNRPSIFTRRAVLAGSLGFLTLNLQSGQPQDSAAGKKVLRGIFPIGQTPFTVADRLDLETLAAEVRFVERTGAHGFVWPQLASEYATLSETERMEGSRAVCDAGKNTRLAIVIGVQAPQAEQAVRYAGHAEKLGATAIIALPPQDEKDLDRIAAYYSSIGSACSLPLFVQAIGNMSVEFVVRLSEQVPTLRFVKDEAGSPLARIIPLREKSNQRLHVFTGNHGVTLIDEMLRGSSGSMPAASFVDLYASVWDLWQAGRKNEARERFAKTLLLVTEVQAYGIEALKYILQLRGVFPNHAVRGKGARNPLDEPARQALGEMLKFLEPYLRT